ncbi:MAG: penicillin-binding protein 2 [Rickettsiaceae bacterium]|nr:penicillin-binding protein 2 [Rickettsiaceae bacterium]
MKKLIPDIILKNLISWSYSKESRYYRLMCVAIFFGISYALIVIQLYSIAIEEQRQAQQIAGTKVQYRGDIVDRNGHVVATNLTLSSLFANPKKVIDPKLTAHKLKKVIKDLDVQKLIRDLSSEKSFVWIKRELTPSDQEEITSLGLPGLFFEEEQRRLYTQGKATSHLLGYVDRDNKGIAGVEKFFDSYLSNPENHNPIKLSIDYRVQNIVSDELDKAITKFSALGGACVVVDVTNGEILGLSSKPDFDPHSPGSASSEQLFNRATLGVYEIGSVIKILTFAIGFDTEAIQINDVYNIQDFVMNKYRIKDYHRHDGWNTVPQMFMNSSNIGAGAIAMEIGKNTYREYMERLGMTKQLPIETSERAHPLVPQSEKITDLNLVTMSYGYGFAISPAHFVQAMVPVVNGGVQKPLTLLKKENEAEVFAENDQSKIFNIETSVNMIKLMRLAVEKGTAKKGAVKGYLVAGKTGTAEKLGPHGYLENHRYSSFVSVMPSINPKYLVFIFLDDPKGIKETFGFATAGFTAAPAASRIMSRIGSLYGIQPVDEDSKEIKEMMHVEYEVGNET